MARRYFGTDGVRGVVGETLTPELVERIGRAATLWADGTRVFVGRDTRGSGVELEEALARGIASAGGSAVLGGVLPTPAVALLALDLGAVVTASHNPPEYNGVKFFAGDGRKLTDAAEEEIEALLDAPPAASTGRIDRVDVATVSYLDHVLDRFGSDLSGLRLAVDCANGAYAGLAPGAFRMLGADVVAIGDEPDGTNINVGCGATDLAAVSRVVVERGLDLGVAFDGDGDRYVLEALRLEGAVLGGEQSGHIIYLRGHVTGDGLAAALLLCGALDGRPLHEAAAVMPRYAQVKENVRVRSRELPASVRDEAARLNGEMNGSGRVLVRPSGTEPVVRVLAEAESPERARDLCATIAALVRRELG